MSDYELKRINALPEASAINDSDVFAIDSAAGTKKVAWETLKGEVDADISEAVSNKADKDGTYPDMAVGSVLGTNTVTDREPYFIRPSASIGDREFDTLVGGTVAWNQLVQIPSSSKSVSADGVIFVDNRNGSYTYSTESGGATANKNINIGQVNVPKGHKIFVIGSFSNTSQNTHKWFMSSSGTNTYFNNGDGVYNVVDDTAGLNLSIISGDVKTTTETKALNIIDLTTLFGSTIADYIYSLETATAGAGVAWVKKYLPNAYYAYCAPTLKHVSGVSAHVMRDANNNVIGNYAIDSTWTGMGIPKLDSNNKLYFDGDRYASDGTVTEKCGIRAYQSGDESLSDAITDGTNTVYKLTTPTTSTATPFTSPQICDPNGTEEYVTTGLVPVGHETEYVENLADKLTDIPDLPTTAGNYHLAVTVDGGTPSYAWVADE